jgi:hypothetical protein
MGSSRFGQARPGQLRRECCWVVTDETETKGCSALNLPAEWKSHRYHVIAAPRAGICQHDHSPTTIPATQKEVRGEEKNMHTKHFSNRDNGDHMVAAGPRNGSPMGPQPAAPKWPIDIGTHPHLTAYQLAHTSS